MQFIKGGYSYRARKELGLAMEIWEQGYVDHRIRDADDYAQHVAYIRQNPVEAHLASCAKDYPCGSAHAGFELGCVPAGLKPELIAPYGTTEVVPSRACPPVRALPGARLGEG